MYMYFKGWLSGDFCPQNFGQVAKKPSSDKMKKANELLDLPVTNGKSDPQSQQ